MTIDAAALRSLHHVHQLLSELRTRLARGPLQIKAGETKVQKLQTGVTDCQEAIKRTKLTTADRELQLKERENRILDMKGRLNACSSNKEYQAIIERIAADEQANSVLSDEILELLEKIKVKESELAQWKEQLRTAESDLEKLRERVQTERQRLEIEISEAEKRLREAERVVPEDARPAYLRVVKAHGAEALAAVDEGNCGGCFQSITQQMISELRLHRLVFCKNCGRLLYLV